MKKTDAHEPILQYAGAGIERTAEWREDPRWIEQALERSETRFIAVWNSRSLLNISRPDQPQAVRLSLQQLGGLGAAVFLGIEDRSAVFAVD